MRVTKHETLPHLVEEKWNESRWWVLGWKFEETRQILNLVDCTCAVRRKEHEGRTGQKASAREELSSWRGRSTQVASDALCQSCAVAVVLSKEVTYVQGHEPQTCWTCGIADRRSLRAQTPQLTQDTWLWAKEKRGVPNKKIALPEALRLNCCTLCIRYLSGAGKYPVLSPHTYTDDQSS